VIHLVLFLIRKQTLNINNFEIEKVFVRWRILSHHFLFKLHNNIEALKLIKKETLVKYMCHSIQPNSEKKKKSDYNYTKSSLFLISYTKQSYSTKYNEILNINTLLKKP